jgi:hypothetical protein
MAKAKVLQPVAYILQSQSVNYLYSSTLKFKNLQHAKTQTAALCQRNIEL